MVFEGLFASALAQTIFVFVLIFALIFGILQKSKLLGDKSQQVNALVSLAIALLVVSVGYALDLITKLIPILAIGIVLILIFLLFVTFFYKDQFDAPPAMKYTAIVLAFLAVAISILYYTGAFTSISNLFAGGNSIVGNLVLILIVVAVFLIAFFGKGENRP